MKTVFCFNVKVYEDSQISSLYLQILNILGLNPTHYCYGNNKISSFPTSGKFLRWKQALLNGLKIEDLNWFQLYEKDGSSLHYPIYFKRFFSLKIDKLANNCSLTIILKNIDDLNVLFKKIIESLSSTADVVIAYSFVMAIDKVPEFITMGIPIQGRLTDGEIAYVVSLGKHDLRKEYDNFPFIFPYMYLTGKHVEKVIDLNLISLTHIERGVLIQTSENMELDNKYASKENFLKLCESSVIRFYYDDELYGALKL